MLLGSTGTADEQISMSESDLLPSELEENSFPPSCSSSSWKLLIDLLCSLGLPAMVHFVLPRWWLRAIVRAERRPPRHSITPPQGLFDLARSSPAPPALAPLLLSSPSVGRHAEDDNVRRSTLQGQVLVEVFTVYADFPFSGIITLFDGRASNYIYGRPDLDLRRKEHADSSSEFKHELLLTGPGRAISAFGSFGIHVEIPTTDEYYGVACDDYWDDFSLQNTPNTITIATSMDSLHVTYAVLSDAVQADLEVMVRLPWLYAFAFVHGHVTAYIGTFEVGTTLFSRDADEPEVVPFTDTQEGRGGIGSEFCIPLDRSPLVVPIGSCLHVKGKLVLNGDETICIDHSMLTESDFFETGWWAEDDDDFAICTAVRLDLRYVWA